MPHSNWRADAVDSRLVACLGAVTLLTGWSPAGAQDTSPRAAAAVAESSPPAAANALPEAKQGDETPNKELAGTSWRLAKILSMDDGIDAPQDPSRYTVEIGADGRTTMRADCNRGTGSWTSASAGALPFGPVAATKALCPPDSLSEKYLAQFQWVRSYMLKDGHLYLATIADGSIVELEPEEPPLAATVLGEEVRTNHDAEMQEAGTGPPVRPLCGAAG